MSIKFGIMFYMYSIIRNNDEALISFGFDHHSNFVSLMIFFKLYEIVFFVLNKFTN
jgi:hypothetical protein